VLARLTGFAKELVRSGLKVVLISRSADKLKSVEAELKAKSPVRSSNWLWRRRRSGQR